jgi:hypothetical protein
MTYADLLLHIDSYPDPMPQEMIRQSVDLAASLGTAVTGLALEMTIPVHSNALADYLIGLAALARSEEARSRAACTRGETRRSCAGAPKSTGSCDAGTAPE